MLACEYYILGNRSLKILLRFELSYLISSFTLHFCNNSGSVFFPQGVISQASTPEASPVHRPDKDASLSLSFSVSLPGEKNPAPAASSGGFTSWFPGIRSTNAQPSSDRTSAVVGPTKSSATEELVSNANRTNCNISKLL